MTTDKQRTQGVWSHVGVQLRIFPASTLIHHSLLLSVLVHLSVCDLWFQMCHSNLESPNLRHLDSQAFAFYFVLRALTCNQISGELTTLLTHSSHSFSVKIYARARQARLAQRTSYSLACQSQPFSLRSWNPIHNMSKPHMWNQTCISSDITQNWRHLQLLSTNYYNRIFKSIPIYVYNVFTANM